MENAEEKNCTLKVLLPQNKIVETQVPNKTPISDLRNVLCDKFNLPANLHSIDLMMYESNNNSHRHSMLTNRRKSSLQISKGNIKMVILKSNKLIEKAVAPQPPIKSESTVRLMVRLTRQRQSILRVDPTASLASIFALVVAKLHLDDAVSGKLELRHPTTGAPLDTSKSLNHYKIRDVYLMERIPEGMASNKSTMKRKAPVPPSPNQPALTTTTTAQSEAKPSKKNRRAPAPPQPQQQEQPTKTSEPESPAAAEPRKLETPPSRPPRCDEDEESRKTSDDEQEESSLRDDTSEASKPEAEEVADKKVSNEEEVVAYNHQDDKDGSVLSTEKDPGRVEEEEKENKEEENIGDDAEESLVGAKLTNVKIDDVNEEEAEDEASSTVVEDDKENQDQPPPAAVVENGKVEDEIKVEEEKSGGDEEKVEQAFEVLDSVLDHNEDIDVSSINSSTNKDGVLDMDDIEVDSIDGMAPVDKMDDFDLPPPPDHLFDDFPTPPRSPDLKQFDEDETDDLPTDTTPAPGGEKEETADAGTIAPVFTGAVSAEDKLENKEHEIEPVVDLVEEKEAVVAPSASLPPPPQPKSLQQILQPKKKKTPPPVAAKPLIKKKPVLTKTLSREEEEDQPHPEVEKTEAMIKELHLNIEKFKRRSSKKINDKQSAVTLKQQESFKILKGGGDLNDLRNRSQNSFKFIPPKAKEQAKRYEDFNAAPVGGVELMNNGEIKRRQLAEDRARKREDIETFAEASSKSTPARSKLPSYYKKFVGVNAFKHASGTDTSN